MKNGALYKVITSGKYHDFIAGLEVGFGCCLFLAIHSWEEPQDHYYDVPVKYFLVMSGLWFALLSIMVISMRGKILNKL